MRGMRGVSTYRTVWISDIHLGTRGCKAEFLLDFLKHTRCETLYLVGDIIDGWRLKRSWYWTDAQTEVVQEILRMSRRGTKVVYIPGNHDEALRDYLGLVMGGVLIQDEATHELADGRRLLVLHGDQFDTVVRYARWLAMLGDVAYTHLLAANTALNAMRRRFGMPYWSLSQYLKHRVKNAVEYISRFEDCVADEARRRGVDGVVCGHIHHAEMRDIDGILYCNDGDWVESCSALVEDKTGALSILYWADASRAVAPRLTAAAPASNA